MLELENEEAAHKCELEMKRVEMNAAAVVARVLVPESGSGARTGKFPKLPTFQDGSDEIDS